MNQVKALIIPIFLFSALAFAEEENPCEGASAMHASICVGEKLELAKKKAGEAYDNALLRAKEEDKWSQRAPKHSFSSLLVQSQKDWLSYRDSHCRLSAESRGGSGGWSGVHESYCVIELIQQRISFLDSLWAG